MVVPRTEQRLALADNADLMHTPEVEHTNFVVRNEAREILFSENQLGMHLK